MREHHDVLERARRLAPVPTLTLEDLSRRKRGRERARRLQAMVVGLTLTGAAISTAFLGFRVEGGVGATSTGASLPRASRPPLVAQPGQYYYSRVHLVTACPVGQESYCGTADTELAGEFWWAPDDSGRIAVGRAHGYGIDPGTFGPGRFPNPNGIDVSTFPTDPNALVRFLLDRSAPDGASPAPLVTPPPDGAPRDGQLWRAVTDLLQDPQVTPTVRAALLEVAAGLQGAHVQIGGDDPVGRPADVISFDNWGGRIVERLFVDPSTHELLAMTETSEVADQPFQVYVVESAGVTDSLDTAPRPADTSLPQAAEASPVIRG